MTKDSFPTIKENPSPDWVNRYREIHDELKNLSKTQLKKRFGTYFTEDFKALEEQPQKGLPELRYWERLRDLLHDYGIEDLGAGRTFLPTGIEPRKTS